MSLFAYPFMVHAIEAGTIVAVMAAVTGWFVVLRRQTFAGHALAVMSFPGASGAALAGLPLAVGYFAACGIAATAIAAGSRTDERRNLAQESAVIGVVQVTGFALGFLFLSLYGGVLENLENLLFGSFLGITTTQVEVLAGVAVCALAFFAVAGRPLLFSSIDDLVARAGGVPVRALEVAFLLVLGLAVASTAQITGVLLVFALLVAPAAAAQQFTPSIAGGLGLSVAIGLLVTWIGLALSYYTNYSVGFYVTTLAFAAYLIARLSRRLRPA
ncbi:MAG TPA: metal ABC transporter permease [Gaiellaceae bacterium]|nr:metal ABC transporter permease [Gaiellaceae bacterium]